MTTVIGLDGCRRGWVGVTLSNGAVSDIAVYPNLAGVPLSAYDCVGIDIPLGSTGETRACDRAARAVLGPRRSSLFLWPPREVWRLPDYRVACAQAHARGLPAPSKQAWSLRTKVAEAEDAWRAEPTRVREVHPELTFRVLAGEPLQNTKRSWGGQQARLAMLREVGVELPPAPGGHLDPAVSPEAMKQAPDDVIDAAVVAWTAMCVAAGRATPVPDPPERDTDLGLPVAIWRPTEAGRQI